MVLVGGDRGELGLWEDEGLEVLGGGGVLAGGVNIDDVKPRLVAVHRVQDHLENRVSKVGNGDALNVAEPSGLFEELRENRYRPYRKPRWSPISHDTLMNTLQSHIFL